MTRGAGHPGWAVVHRLLTPEFAEAERRVALARLRVGEAAPALSEELFLAFLQQQRAMIEETARALVAGAAQVSRAANAHDPEVPATVGALERCCRDFCDQLAVVVRWGENLWATTPPVAFAETFSLLREIPGKVLVEMRPYLATVAATANGEITSHRTLTIDIQSLIDQVARAGRNENRRAGGTSTSGCGCLLMLVLGAVLAFLWWFGTRT